MPLLFFACRLQYFGGNSGDKDWLLYLSGQLLQGKKLDTDWIEVNPPLIVWLYTLPAFVAERTGMADFHVLAITGLLASLGSSCLCLRVLHGHPGFQRGMLKGLFAFLLFLLIVRTPPSYFFDRDHIFLTLALPYFLRWLPALSDKPLPLKIRLLVGGLAAVGFCLKPHCLIVWACIQILVLWRTRAIGFLFALENGVVYGFALLYLLCIFLFVPEYAYTILPMALATYSAFNRRLDGLIYAAVAAFTLAVAFCEFRPGARSPLRGDIGYLAGLCFALLLYGLSNNGWGYSYNPLLCLCLLTVYWLVLEFRALQRQAVAEGVHPQRLTFGKRAAMTALALHMGAALLVIGVTLGAAAHFDCAQYPACMLDQALKQEVRMGSRLHSFTAISPVVGSWSRISKETGALWQSHFNHLWMLPKFFISGEDFTQKHTNILKYVAARLSDTLDRQKPDIVFMDAGVYSPLTHNPVDLKSYFSSHDAFKDAMAHYVLNKTIDYCGPIPSGLPHPMGCMFDVYRRIP